MRKEIIEKTIYGTPFKVIKDNIKVDKDFQIPIIEDRAFKYICNVYPKVIIKFLASICSINEDLIESAYFMDTTMPDLKFNDKKMTVDLLVNISSDEYINIEANTSKGKSVQIKNINYMFRFILSKQKMSEALKSIKLTQVNFDLYSEKFMGGINNVFSSRNSLNNKILPEMPVVIHIGLDEGFNLGEKNGILIGEKRGEKNGKLKRSIEIAKNLLEKGISIDIISESTNLPKKEILKLQNN